jgi:hypothetical protein
MTTFHGRYALGQKVKAADSAQEPGLLGDERDDVVFRVDSSTDMQYSENSGRVRVKWVKNTSGSALKPGSLVSWDLSGARGDTDVVQCTNASVPCGIVDPFLTSDVADDELFLIVTKADRVSVLSGAAFSRRANLVVNSAGKAVTGAGSRMQALDAAAGADVLTDVRCDFCGVGIGTEGTARLHRSTTLAAAITTGNVTTLLPAVPGYKYRIHDASLIANGNTVGTASTVDVVGTQSASAVKLMAGTAANLTANAIVRIGGTGGTALASGASFAECDANTPILLGATTGTVSGATSVTVLLTYELVAA